MEIKEEISTLKGVLRKERVVLFVVVHALL